MKDQTLQELVDAYCKEQTQGLRRAIISEATPMLKSIIGKIPRSHNALARYEDLESAGIVGLLQALDKYDGYRDVKFSTFAYYRIRGNIVDYVRSIDVLPRAQRTNYGRAQGVMQQLGQTLGREPKDAEVAEALEMPFDKYQRLLGNAQKRAVLSIDKPAYGEDGDGTMAMFLEDESVEQPDAHLDRQRTSEQLQLAIEELGERDRLILALYYYENLTLSKIASLLSLTDARISQIIRKLLLELKSTLTAREVVGA